AHGSAADLHFGPAEARVAGLFVGRRDPRRVAGLIDHGEHVMHDPVVAGHDLRQGEEALLREGRRDAEAAIDIAALRLRGEWFGPDGQGGCAAVLAGRERARRRPVARVPLGRAALDPAQDRGDLLLREPADAGEVPVAGDGLPWRHRAGAHHLRDLVAPAVDVLVDGELEGRGASAAMTLLAMLLE